MDEATWLTSSDPAVMLSWAQGQDLRGDRLYPLSNRKLRLWVFAMRDAENAVTRLCPTRWHDPKLDDTRELAACVETWASGENSVHLVPMALRAALLREIVGNPFQPVGWDKEADMAFRLTCKEPYKDCRHPVRVLTRAMLTPDVLAIAAKAYGECERCPRCDSRGRCAYCVRCRQQIHHEATSCPFCHYSLTETVACVCKGRYAERMPFDASVYPALHDALLDAGCTDAAILNHLRATHWVCCCGKPRDGGHDHNSCGPPIEEPVPHVRGCWVLDLLLGKE